MTFKYFEEDPAVTAWGEAMRAKYQREKEEAVASHPEVHGDVVNMPSHYRQLPVECVEVAEHFGYLLGNVIKYIWRHQHKGKPLQDLRKAQYYLNRAVEKMEQAGE